MVNHSPVHRSTGPRVHEPRVHESGSTGQRTAENRTGPGFSQGENSSSNSSENLFKSTSFFQLQGGVLPGSLFSECLAEFASACKAFFHTTSASLPELTLSHTTSESLPALSLSHTTSASLPGSETKYFHYQIPSGTF